MRNKILRLSSLLVCGMLVLSETYGETMEPSMGWPISGTPVLQERMRGLVEFYKKPTLPQKKPIEWKVGQKDTLWAYDFSNSSHYQVPATCRAVGQHCYILVEDSAWTNRVDSVAVAGLVKAFDQSCEADPHKGIYQMDVETFGNPPDPGVDGDPRIFILLLDIKDDCREDGTYYGGYFYSLNEYDTGTPDCRDCQYSNFREMFYVDCNPLDVKSESAKGVLAHEFQHLIHWGKDPKEKNWVNEGCSGYAEYVCGYRSRRVGDHFLANPNNSLIDWIGTFADYEQTFMFIAYLAEHYGGRQTIKELVAEGRNGIAGVNEVLRTKGADFTSLFADWVIANYLDNGGVYGYQMFDLPTYKIPTTQITSLPDTLWEAQPRLEHWAAEYIELPTVAGIEMEFRKGVDSNFLLQVIKKVKGVTSVIDFSSTGSLSTSGYDTLTLVVVRTAGRPYPYQCIFNELPNWVELAEIETLPGKFLLGQNFPNPFNATTTITFSLPAATFVILDIFNSGGQRVRRLVSTELGPGQWNVGWDGRDAQGRDLASGIYFYRLQAGGYTQTRQMILLK